MAEPMTKQLDACSRKHPCLSREPPSCGSRNPGGTHSSHSPATVKSFSQSSNRQDCEVRPSSSTVFSDLTPRFVSYAHSAALQGSSDARRAYLEFVTGAYPKNDERRKIPDERSTDRNAGPAERTKVLAIKLQH